MVTDTETGNKYTEIVKKSSMSMKAITTKDKRRAGSNWAFVAFELGSVRGGVKTHAAGTKRSYRNLSLQRTANRKVSSPCRS